MKSYECTVAPGAADPSGLATVPSICGCIFRALRKDLCEVDLESVLASISEAPVANECGFTRPSDTVCTPADDAKTRLEGTASGILPLKWVLKRSELEIDERPRRGDLFNILVNSVPEKALNNNVISINKVVLLTDSEGVEIGRGRTCWILAKNDSEALEGPGNDLLNPKNNCRTTVFSPRQPEDLSEQPCQRHEAFAEQPEQFLRSFFSLLPEDSISSGLQTKIDLDFVPALTQVHSASSDRCPSSPAASSAATPLISPSTSRAASPLNSPDESSPVYYGFPAMNGDEMTFNVRKDYDDRYTFIARSGNTTLFRALLQTA